MWHVNCCNAEINGGGGWGIFNAVLGWENSATYGSVISYNLYWLAVIIGFLALRFKETHGHWPLLSRFSKSPKVSEESSTSDEAEHQVSEVKGLNEKANDGVPGRVSTAIEEIPDTPSP